MAVKAKKQDSSTEEVEWPFGKKNYILFGAALVVIVIGYILLGQGSMTLSPVLLTLGYCVLIPAAILWKNESEEIAEETPTDIE
ncbi:MAG TPA: DUF3098 domain-containing protein [candidate division Zixibacteria bacterium]|nr:DUF3098 domain-containing protein [candidate division Zixibacteria bacterium]